MILEETFLLFISISCRRSLKKVCSYFSAGALSHRRHFFGEDRIVFVKGKFGEMTMDFLKRRRNLQKEKGMSLVS